MRRLWTVLAGVILLVAGCSPSQEPPQGRPVAGRTAPAASPVPAHITLAFGGDIHFEGRVRPLLAEPATTFGPVAEILRAADLAMVNLETPVTTRGTAQAKEFTFRAPPEAFDAIKAAGIDVVSNANNHGEDYGRISLTDTLSYAAAAGMPLVGAGLDAASAYAPWTTTIKGLRFAILGFTQVNTFNDTWPATATRAGLAYAITPAQLDSAAEAVRLARTQADVVIVFMHWGQEREACPTSLQRSTASLLAQAGASIIVGAHPHILQGGGWLGDTYVQYSLGNFLWYSNTSNLDSGVLQVTLRGATVTAASLVPAKIHPTIGQPIPATGSEADRIVAKWNDLRSCTGLAATRS